MTDPPRLFDMFGSLPTAERLAFEIRSWGSDPGYRSMFAARFSKLHGISKEVLDTVSQLSAERYRERSVELLAPYARSTDDILTSLRAAGAVRTVVHNLLPTVPGLTNDDLAETISGRQELIGFVRIDPTGPAAAAREIRRCVEEYGFRGVTLTPFWHRVRADDPSLSPIYEAALEMSVPVWIHTSVNWVRTTPLTYEHPLHLDAVASRYPELRIIAGHGGWPWLADMVAVAWRQPNVYIDVSAFRPRHIATPGTGWDMLWHYLPRTLQDKVVFGSTWQLLGMPLADVLSEVRSLALPADVERKWLIDNASGLFGLHHA